MKTTWLLVLPVLLLPRLCMAQHFRFGVKAGANYTRHHYRSFISASNSNWLLRGHAGLLARWSFGPEQRWNVQTELLFSGKGSGYDFDGNGTTNVRQRLNYLDLPILFKVKRRGFTAEAGPQISTVLSGSGDSPYLLGTFRRATFAPVQFGYVVGVGYELASGLSLTVRYTDDLTAIYRAELAGPTGPYTQGIVFGGTRNSVLQAQLGYLLPGPQ